MDEFDFIREMLAPLASDPPALGLNDDAANYLLPDGQSLVLTMDALVEGVHFPEKCDAEIVAARVLAANLADLTAKGATPVGCLMTLGVPPHWDVAWLKNFTTALGRGLMASGLALWGGDTVRTAQGFVTLAAHGLVPKGKMIRRDGAQIGDDVYVTGPIGDAYLGLQAVLAGEKASAYESPEVPLHLAVPLRHLAHAAIDISDGLAADLDHICVASNVGMVIEAAAIPISAAGQAFIANGGDALAALLSGGDDCQIAFTAAAQTDLTALKMSRIGQVVGGDCVRRACFMDKDNQEIMFKKRGFRHF